MSTDTEKSVSSRADKHLQEIEKKYPGFIHMGAQNGIKLSFQLQSIVQPQGELVRGYRLKENDTIPSALNGCLYSILRTKQQRRALVLSILKQFEDQGVSYKFVFVSEIITFAGIYVCIFHLIFFFI